MWTRKRNERNLYERKRYRKYNVDDVGGYGVVASANGQNNGGETA